MTNPSIVWQATLGCTFQPPEPWSTTITSVYLNGSTQVTWLAFTTNTQDGYGAYAIQMRAPMPTTSSSSISLDNVPPPLTSWPWENNNSSGRDGGDGGGSGGGGSGLSSGAAAGIGIAAALAAFGAGLLIFMLWRRQRGAQNGRAKLETREEDTGDHGSWGSKTRTHGTFLELGNKSPDQPEMSGQDARHCVSRQHEVDGSNVAELSG